MFYYIFMSHIRKIYLAYYQNMSLQLHMENIIVVNQCRGITRKGGRQDQFFKKGTLLLFLTFSIITLSGTVGKTSTNIKQQVILSLDN